MNVHLPDALMMLGTMINRMSRYITEFILTFCRLVWRQDEAVKMVVISLNV